MKGASKIVPTPAAVPRIQRWVNPGRGSGRMTYVFHPERAPMNALSPLFAAAALAGGTLLQQKTDAFEWQGAMAGGKTIELVGVNGSIDASGSSGAEVQVSAIKKGRKSDPREVEIRVVEHGDGVTICAVYPSSRRGEENECKPDGGGRSNTRNNDVRVEWTVRVPRGVLFAGRTVNGDVVARGLTAAAEAHTVNGDITIETTSWATASTVNGSIGARIGATLWDGDAEFDTVNGRITVDLPHDASMEVHASTVNGSMTADFPLTVQGKWGPKRMRGTVGEGGRTLSLSTVNGDLMLRRR